MTAIVFILAVLLAGVAVGIAIGAACADDIKVIRRRTAARFARSLRKPPPLQKHSGRHVPRPDTAPMTLLAPAETTEHADAMWQASEKFLPAIPYLQDVASRVLPQGENPYPRYVSADRPITRKQTPDHPPWTGSQQALAPEMEARMEAAELDRRHYLMSHLPDYAGMSDDDIREDMQRVYASRHALPAAHDPVTEWQAPVYRETSVAGVLAGERLAERTLT